MPDIIALDRRWPMVIFYRVLNVAAINAFAAFNQKDIDQNMLRRNFLENLSFQLIMDHLKRRAKVQQVPRLSRMRIQEICKIKPEVVTKQTEKAIGRCRYCDTKKNRKTKYKCNKCSKFLCLEHVVPMCRYCVKDDGDETE